MGKTFKIINTRLRGIAAMLALTLTTTLPTPAQTVISGRVTDAHTDEEIVGASVVVKTAPSTGASTAYDGSFALTIGEELPVTLVVSYVGFRTQEIDVYDTDEPLLIEMSESRNSFKDVVVIGYGTQKRKELTGSIASVDLEKLQQVGATFDNMLGGAVSGLNVSQNTGLPGSTTSIRIRGGNSITGGNEPLYVIDGVLYYNDGSATTTGMERAAANFNPLAAINPGDIESVEVLKDVSATAIYGSRGANGVIIVTTKSGKKGRTNVEYQYTVGWQTASKKLDLMDAQQWGVLYLEIASSSEIESTGVTSDVVKSWGAGTDWQSAALRTAVTQNHQVSVSGGDEKTRYLISGNYNDQDGIVLNTGFKRYAGRLNLERDIFNGFTVGVNATASKAVQKGLSDYTNGTMRVNNNNNSFSYVLRTTPAFTIYNSDGSYNHSNIFEYGDLRNGDVTPNPIAELTEVTAETKTNNLIGSTFAKWTFFTDFTLKLSASTNIIHTTQNYYSPSDCIGGLLVGGYGSVGNKDFESYQYEATLNWKHVYSLHSIDALAGYTSQVTNIEYAVATAEEFSNESLTYHSLQSGATVLTPLSGASKSTLHSVLGRVNYTYNERYHLTATLRTDGSSRFAKNHRWGWFPSLGLSWNLNEENFLKDSKTIDELKVRGSLGTVGNQEIGDYQALATYESVRYYFGNTAVTGYLRSNLENDDLKWETTTQYNLGFDISLFKGRLTFVFDTYYKKTHDLLLEIPVEQTTGFDSQLQNIGSVENKGVEFAVNAAIIDRKNLTWNISANIAHNSNKVTDLGGLDSIIDDYTIIKKGSSLGSFYGWVFDGIVQTGDDIDAVPTTPINPVIEAGDIKYVDQNSDGEITQDDDRVILGSIQPDFTYGLSTTVRYKSWSFYAALQGSQGNEVYNRIRHILEVPATESNVSAVLANRWTETNPSTSIPRASAENANASYLDSRYVEDASYLRLKTLTLSYSLPVRLAKNASATKIKLFASAQNLFTITGYDGFDPEVSGGIDYGAYPSARTYSVGVNITY